LDDARWSCPRTRWPQVGSRLSSGQPAPGSVPTWLPSSRLGACRPGCRRHAWERADLVAVVPVHELVSRLRGSFERLAAKTALDPGLWEDVCLIDVAPELENGSATRLAELHHLGMRELFGHLAQRLAGRRQLSSRLEALQLRMQVIFDLATVQRVERALALPGNYDLLTADERMAVLCSRSSVVLQAPTAEPLDRLAWPDVPRPAQRGNTSKQPP
jgi:hypothetical protein